MKKKRHERLQAEPTVAPVLQEVKPLDKMFVPLVEAFADGNGGVVDPGLIVMMIPESVPNPPTQAQVALYAERHGLKTERLSHDAAALPPPKVRAMLFQASAELEEQLAGLRKVIAELQVRVETAHADEAASMRCSEQLKAEIARLNEAKAKAESEAGARLELINAELERRQAELAALVERRTAEAADIIAAAEETAVELRRCAEQELESARTNSAGSIAGAQTEAGRIQLAANSEAQQIIEAAKGEVEQIVAAARTTALQQAADLLAAERQRIDQAVVQMEAARLEKEQEASAVSQRLTEANVELAVLRQQTAQAEEKLTQLRQAAAEIERSNAAKAKTLERRENLLKQAIAAFEKTKAAAPKIVEEARTIRRQMKDLRQRAKDEAIENRKFAEQHAPRVKAMMIVTIVLVIACAVMLYLKYK